MWKRRLNVFILVFIAAGIVFGSLLNLADVSTDVDAARVFNFGFYLFQTLNLIGSLFLSALKMIIIPVIFASIAYGLASMSKGTNVGKVIRRTIIYYLATTSMAVFIGLVLVNTFKPGGDERIISTVTQMLDNEQVSPEVRKKVSKARFQLRKEGLEGLTGVPLMFVKLKNLVLSLMPSNIFTALSEGMFLPIIVFSIICGLTLLVIREQVPEIIVLLERMQHLFFTILSFIIATAPIGFFAIVCELCWTVGLEGISSIWLYAFAVVVGLAVHGLIILPLICRVFGARSPLVYAGQVKSALLMAFSTASSSATLPTTMNCVEKKAGISRDCTSFVLPLGATVNMDGTAIYESIALVTLMQAYATAVGVMLDLSTIDLIVIFITVTLAAVGAAGVPGAGIFMLIMLMSTVPVGDRIGIPAHLIGLIIILDRPLDMLRTCINVWGDTIGCAVVERVVKRAG